MNIFFLFVLFTEFTSHLVFSEEICWPETPNITYSYVSHRADDSAEPHVSVKLYWTPIFDKCQDENQHYYEIWTCHKLNCSGENWIEKSNTPMFTHNFNETADFNLHIQVRSLIGYSTPRGTVIRKLSGNWSDVWSIDLSQLSPEPVLLVAAYNSDQSDSTSDSPQDPTLLYIRPDIDQYSPVPALFEVSWPALFDWECCDTEGIQMVPADAKALNFNLTQAVWDIERDLRIPQRLGFVVDWVSATHFEIVSCGEAKEKYCIYHIDDEIEDSPLQFHIYESENRICQIIYNSMTSQLFWTEEIPTSDSYRVKMKFKDQQELNLNEACPCMKHLALTYPAITLDWRTFYEENHTEPGILFVANDTLWRFTGGASNHCICSRLISNVSELTENNSIIKIRNDWSYFYWMEKNGMIHAYDWKMQNIYTIWGRNELESVGEITQMRPVGAEFRPFAPAECYFPQTGPVTFRMTSITEAILSVNLLWNSSDLCKNIAKPPVEFRVEYAIIDDHTNFDLTCLALSCSVAGNVNTRNTTVHFHLTNMKNNKTCIIQTEIGPVHQFKDHYPYNEESDIRNWKFPARYDPDPKTNIGAIAGSVSVILLLLVVIAAMIAVYFTKGPKYFGIPRIWPHQLKRVKQLDDNMAEEIDVRLGGGKFGDVFLEKYKGTKFVATKYLKKNATDYDEKCFVDEILLMWTARGPYIVELLGICLTKRPYSFIMEYVVGKTLHEHLQEVAKITSENQLPIPGSNLQNSLSEDNYKDLMKALMDAAKALERLDKLCILHRDIAARNLLVEYSKTSGRIEKAKLTDFGLAKQVGMDDNTYTIPHGKIRELPIALFALECLEESTFSPKSEIWQFGILMWETFTLGSIPYGSLRQIRGDEFEILRNFLKSGQRLGRPALCQHACHDKLYNLMTSCWATQASQRPTIYEVSVKLDESNKKLLGLTKMRKLIPQPLNRSSSDQQLLSKSEKPNFGKKASMSEGARHGMAIPLVAFGGMPHSVHLQLQSENDIPEGSQALHRRQQMPTPGIQGKPLIGTTRFIEAYPSFGSLEAPTENVAESENSQSSGCVSAEKENDKDASIKRTVRSSYSRPIQL